jgi:N-acyl-D-aspartate/D-glutamate deacylase
VHIFHLKAAGQQNWGKMAQAISRISAARAEGQQVAADVYPYINNGLGMAAFIHPRHAARGQAALIESLQDESLRAQIRREMETDFSYENWYRHIGFDWDRVVLGGFTREPYAAHNGKSLAQIAQALEKDAWDVFFDAVRLGAFALPQSMSEANLIRALRQDFISFCTDVGPAVSRIASHPRAHGAFPRILARYVREQGVLTLEQAISQMTSVAANEVYQYDRGRLAPGLAADLVVFDPARVMDRATLGQPSLASEGVRYVLVNGQLVLRDNQYTGARPGRVLKRNTKQ